MRWIRVCLTAAAIGVAGAASAADVDPLAPLTVSASLDQTVVVTAPTSAPAVPHIINTVALDAGMTAYDVRWRRVSAADQKDPRIVAIASAATANSRDPLALLRTIQADVSRRIRFRTDLETYRVSDYWASAAETLTRGEGDGEDIAILKMQALKAAGFAARDLYLSVGRERTRGVDALLVARVGDRFYLLDDRNPVPLASPADGRFQPVITLGRNSAWLHGRRISRFSASTARNQPPAKLSLSR